MIKYLKIFDRVWRISFIQTSMYPVNFWLSGVTSLCYSLLSVLLIWFLFAAGGITEVAGFSVYEIYFVIAWAQIVEMMGWTLAGSGTINLRQWIHTGYLDYFLLLPVNIVFISACHYFWLAQVLPLLFSSVVLLAITLPVIAVSWSVISILKLLVILVFSFLVYWCLFWIASLLWFFWPKFNGLRNLIDYVSDIVKYPRQIYPVSVGWLLRFVFPILVVANPIYFWLKGEYDFKMMMIDGVVVAVVIFVYMMLWKFGLRKYNSAN